MVNSKTKRRRTFLLLMIGLLLGSGLFTLPFAQPVAAATDGYSISNGSPPSTRPSIAISPDSSRTCVTWTTFDQNPNQTYVRIYATGTGAWTPDLSQPAVNVARNDGGNSQGNTARCAIDGAGRVHVVWVEYPDGRVRYSMLPAGADAGNVNNWTYPIDITSAAGEGDGQNPDIVSIFADGSGNVWLAYWSLNNNGVFVRNWVNGIGWGGATKVSGSGGKHPRIGADNAGYVHVIYQQPGAGIQYTYRDANNGSWSQPTQLPGSSGAIDQSGIAVNRTAGDVHVVFSVAMNGDDDNTRVVKYVKKSGPTGTAFAGPTNLTGQGNHVVPRIAWSPSGKLTMVSDKRDTRVITIATSNNDGASWSGASDLTSGNNGQWPSVAMDAGGNSYITYWTGDNINFVQLGSATNPGGGSPTPTPPPAAPPVITTVNATPSTLTSVTVTWRTNTPSSSRVFFSPDGVGIDTNCTTANCTAGDPAMVTDHAVTVRGLGPNAAYNYQVRAIDAFGQATLDPVVRTIKTNSLEIVGNGKTADGKFSALVYVPAGTSTLRWSTVDQTATGIFSGATTTTPQVVAFAGDLTVSDPAGVQRFTIYVEYGNNPSNISTTASVEYNPSFKFLFNDVDINSASPYAVAIYELQARGIVQGSDGSFRPLDPIARAEGAAIVARSLTWIPEHGSNSFSDLASVDAELQNDVKILADYGVARGFGDGTYQPTGAIGQAQIVSLITRAMVAKGYWQYQTDDGSFPEVPPSSGHRQDLVTFNYYTNGALSQFFSGGNYATNAERRFVARVVYEAVKWRESQVNGASLYEIP